MYKVYRELLLETYNTMRLLVPKTNRIGNKDICMFCGCEINIFNKNLKHSHDCLVEHSNEILRELKKVLESE